MSKNIIICADGTGNSTIKGRGTNVFKLYEAVDENGHRFDNVIEQVAIYHDGVGTESLKWLRIFGGATGWGLSRNVKSLYAELSRVYDPGDRIYLFGFSRGAFTVRTLAGLIASCGILERNDANFGSNAAFDKAIDQRYSDYRSKYKTLLEKAYWAVFGKFIKRDSISVKYAADLARSKGDKTHLVDFVGVWDTVDAVGLPLAIADIWNEVVYAFKFPDGKLNQEVGVGRHALALDEERSSFTPVLWNEVDYKPAGDPRIKQVWFAGVHSNVGGGYPHQGMSLVALDWMISEAASMPELGAVPAGERLRFIPQVRDLIRAAADVNGKLYDSRAGLGVFYRWKPRDAQRLCDDKHVLPRVHRTVLERIARATDGYAPGSLPVSPEVISTSAGPLVTTALQECVRTAHERVNGRSLVASTSPALGLGRLSYFLFIFATLAVASMSIVRFLGEAAHVALQLAAIPPYDADQWRMIFSAFNSALRAGDWTPWRRLASVIAETATSSHWINIIVHVLWDHWWILIVGFAGFWLSLAVDAWLDTYYSSFWHHVRKCFGRALKLKNPLPGPK